MSLEKFMHAKDSKIGYFIEQGASDFTKFPRLINGNLLSEIVTIGNCLLSNFPKQSYFRVSKHCAAVSETTFSAKLRFLHIGRPMMAYKCFRKIVMVVKPPAKAFSTYRARAIYSWMQHSKLCHIPSINV
ncbi:LOW QUALITY PROTEIN: hypothetical protein MXB_1197 [Myxobolus squamalis]|nr:LOW QUALITY PROTEIN: hypothetical protein MXB_1197 [Myxobolus squamalis]